MSTEEVRKVVILGANGTMGSGATALFAARGFEVAALARTQEKANEGLEMAQNAVRANVIAERISLGTYDEDLERTVRDADLVLECVAEDMAIKRPYFERVDRARREGSVVATVSSGLSINEMCADLSDDLRKHFMGIHLFNPPNVIVGTELIPARETDPQVLATVADLLRKRLGRVVVECRDKPAFAGNRVGFKVLNECAQLAMEHGVEMVDTLIGPHTGRALPPLATIDLVGWDVHKAIVDNVHANTDDEAHAAFALPSYMASLIEAGHLGNKTPRKGGFFRRAKAEDGSRVKLALDPASGEYRPAMRGLTFGFVEEMKRLHRMGRYREAMSVLLAADRPEADLTRRVVFGYISYGLSRVGPDEVVSEPLQVDLIMGYGFNWAPPSVLVDVFGRDATVEQMKALGLPVPEAIERLGEGEPLFKHERTEIGRFFSAR